MGARDANGTILIDPDLLIPNEQSACEKPFWSRFDSAIPEHPKVLTVGEFTKDQCMQFYLDAFCGPVATIPNILAGFDVRNVYTRALNLQVTAAVDNDGDYRVDSASYHPLYGSEEALIAFEYDLSTSPSRYIYTDMASWEGVDGPISRTSGNITLIDCSMGEAGCARAFLYGDTDYKHLQEMAADAFPCLRFCDDAWNSLRKLRNNEREYAPILASYMAVLNDRALKVWRDNVGRDKREHLMSALGINCSIEQPQIMAKERLRRMRTFSYGSHEIVMSWHAKILGYTGRMYFYVDDELKYDDKPYVYIGHFTDHLETLDNRRK